MNETVSVFTYGPSIKDAAFDFVVTSSGTTIVTQLPPHAVRILLVTMAAWLDAYDQTAPMRGTLEPMS